METLSEVRQLREEERKRQIEILSIIIQQRIILVKFLSQVDQGPEETDV